VDDALNVDAYAEHLADVNEVKDVVAKEDIVNDRGLLLVKRGQPISRQQVERIVQYKLLKPLEASVDIADSLTLEKILASITDLLVDDSMRELYAKKNFADEIKRRTQLLFRFPILVQKLTVLSMQMPREYEKTLQIAWFGLAIAARLKLPDSERDILFVAALLHDIGLLHIPRAIAEKQGDYTPAEWRAMQSHAIVGHKILQQMQGLPAAVATAVLEHHEMRDGTGYPAGRFGQELSIGGQIIGLVDSLYAIYTNKSLPGKRTLRDMLPIAQIHSYIYHLDMANAVIQILRECKPDEAAGLDDETVADFSARFLQRRAQLQEYFERIVALVQQLPSKEQRLLRAAQTVTEHLGQLLSGSGVLSDGYARWTQQVADDRLQHAYREMEDAYLILQEVDWQLLKLTRLLHTIADHENLLSATEREFLQDALANLPELSSVAL
jgi:HD-GYP domain-containing protein (c-di-GMP phosphodiesterase class II)